MLRVCHLVLETEREREGRKKKETAISNAHILSKKLHTALRVSFYPTRWPPSLVLEASELYSRGPETNGTWNTVGMTGKIMCISSIHVIQKDSYFLFLLRLLI